MKSLNTAWENYTSFVESLLVLKMGREGGGAYVKGGALILISVDRRGARSNSRIYVTLRGACMHVTVAVTFTLIHLYGDPHDNDSYNLY